MNDRERLALLNERLARMAKTAEELRKARAALTKPDSRDA
jgi:hypothetical protein